MGFPETRLRRLREHPSLRRMARETELSVSHFAYPLFVVDGRNVRREIPALPGQFHLSVDALGREAEEVVRLGIPAVLLFGHSERKDAKGTGAARADGVVPRAIRALKASAGDRLAVIADVCLCPYTSHGHCGVAVREGGGHRIDNDASLEPLARAAVAYAQAGADMVAPSDMMDGRVGAIRRALDRNGFSRTAILSYAAKYASAFYGPFREAVDSAPRFGDRRGYQLDPANVREALREVALDLDEGADLVMVKPALAYLDVIRRVRDRFDAPVAAYNVSGEYAAIQAAAAKGWLDKRQAALETLLAMRRAGADLILTYWAKEAAGWLKER